MTQKVVVIMNFIKAFFQSESAGGISLLSAAILGVLVANSPIAAQYFAVMQIHVGPMTILEWVNDALMALFFLYVGIEIKKEMISGELDTKAKRVLPVLAAFAGVITMLGNKVSTAMKAFLAALAIIDDLIAIVVIALFYGAGVNFMDLIAAAAVTGLLIYTNKQGYLRPLPYCVLGLVLWYLVLKSGVHATIAGVVLAMTIPFKGKVIDKVVYPMEEWAHALRNWVNFLIIPLFSFLNAGVSFADFSIDNLFHPVIIGVSFGLILGKQLGIFSAVYILVQSKAIKMPTKTTWPEIYGTAILCGIGFTMSLFVATLAFPPGITQEMAKVGIFIGSITAGLLGAIVLILAYQIRKMRGKI